MTTASAPLGDVELLDGFEETLHVEVVVEQFFIDDVQRIFGCSGRLPSHDSSSVVGLDAAVAGARPSITVSVASSLRSAKMSV